MFGCILQLHVLSGGLIFKSRLSLGVRDRHLTHSLVGRHKYTFLMAFKYVQQFNYK